MDPNIPQKFSGINKLIIIALAENANESYDNVEYLFSLINLNALCGVVNYVISSDLKLIMCLLGLQTCAATHPCPWCEVKYINLLSKGDQRTFENIVHNFENWESQGGKWKDAKLFGNLICWVCFFL